ncbi:hypothetical protein BS47DRAFT_1373667 [Hydnum rufescens UP504]|uniref:Uncharacterized protein n=1 Tax=Hydnum rufescens UP504 TaxID=1448309 RepID=A0A9P6ANA7_9AGAM|nr:hypothetical protein BS47DRAFT_1373667 [Hydnum rufescens UP504]
MTKYLKARGHEFATADSLRRRFANALSHYQVLVRLVNAEMAKIIDSFHGPSIYLQSRCPLCFGGGHTSGLGVSTIACIDANFQIKRNHDKDRRKGFEGETGARDPKIFSPRTVELSQVELDMMEAREDDAVEPGMNVPNLVLDTCGDSFIAADGDRIKASTQWFDDTGLMALLCHHDIALYVANMRTAGEKQFYAFALVAALFKELPEWWTVGILYDIVCQIHQSLLKWNFMPEWHSRIVFGVSVFHAYGHQWMCQLWYHPRKSEIWGLSDGEGCERFWSELRRLIPSLRVTGYHQRLFIIDLQVEHIDELKQQGLAKWLHDCTLSAHKWEGEAMARLGGQSISYLLDQFNKLMPRQSKTKGARAIEHILSMTQTAQSLRIHLKETVDELGELATDSSTVVVEDELRAKIEAMRSSIKHIESNIKKKTEELHLSDRMSHKELDHLKTDKWVNLQLNIRIVRDQILIKLRARKFELVGLDCADTGCELDHRMKEHVEKAMKSRVSGVQGALKRYEEIRREMMKLRGKGSVAANAYIPPEISSSVYKLDVDEDIWQVPHHEDLANFPDGEVPAWLRDKGVWDGIQAAQEILNCRQELECCKAEFSNLHTWFMTQCSATWHAYTLSCDAEVKFFALLELHHLHDLVEAWQRHSSAMLGSDGQIGWMNLPEQPPPLCYGRIQILCGPVSPVANSLTGEAVDGVSDAASSDDDENGELEDAPVPQDIAFLAALDALEELVGDDA